LATPLPAASLMMICAASLLYHRPSPPSTMAAPSCGEQPVSGRRARGREQRGARIARAVVRRGYDAPDSARCGAAGARPAGSGRQGAAGARAGAAAARRCAAAAPQAGSPRPQKCAGAHPLVLGQRVEERLHPVGQVGAAGELLGLLAQAGRARLLAVNLGGGNLLHGDAGGSHDAPGAASDGGAARRKGARREGPRAEGAAAVEAAHTCYARRRRKRDAGGHPKLR
jgi:hypothetical protein